MNTCTCCSGKTYEDCCAPIHAKLAAAETAEQLMRARYCAFTKGMVDFIYDSFFPAQRRLQHKPAIAQWAAENKWMQLEVLSVSDSVVEFKAHYLNAAGEVEIHHEKSSFKKLNGSWYYTTGQMMS